MFQYIHELQESNDLEELEDILNTLVFEDEPSIFDEDNTIELMETALHLMEEYVIDNPTAISEPDFHEDLLEEIKDIFYIQFEEEILRSDFVEDDLNELLEDAFNIFITTFYPERSNNIVLTENTTNVIEDDTNITNENNSIKEQKIIGLREIPQPVQRTPEWYQFRWNLITASNAWKAFESQSTINQLIYEKCQPIKKFDDNGDEDVKMVNTNTSLHWGQKFEPLSVLIYEHKYNTQVEDFGCIQHKTYKFIGASPDGINVDKNCDRYGRMLEIKNVVSRDINGIPKKEYWVQMQLQMEVCDLDECDFLETKFTEYNDYTAYKNDTTDKMKGIIIYFHTKDGKPFYVYKPLTIVEETDVTKWEDDTLSLYQSDKYNYTYMKFIYWKLDVFSCVLVLRNKDWFKNNIPQLEKVWKIIEQERVTGYEHRAPVKKVKKEAEKPFTSSGTQGCLLKWIKKLD
jgi:putative phage-type endonuclease